MNCVNCSRNDIISRIFTKALWAYLSASDLMSRFLLLHQDVKSFFFSDGN